MEDVDPFAFPVSSKRAARQGQGSSCLSFPIPTLLSPSSPLHRRDEGPNLGEAGAERESSRLATPVNFLVFSVGRMKRNGILSW